MCKDEPYILAGLCCVSKQCGAYGLSLAKTYVESYCEEWKVKPPELENLACATVTSHTSTISSTATSSATERPTNTETPESTDADESSSPTRNEPNAPLIGGIAGGIAALLLLVAGMIVWRRKRKAAKVRLQRAPKPPSPTHGDNSTLEVVQLSEIPPKYPPTGGYSYGSQQGSQFSSNVSLPSETAGACAYPVQTYSPLQYDGRSELGNSGARPHGSELGGRPLIPPRPELQGMSFMSHHPNMRTELPP